MENTYSFLRELAGSWMLIAMMMFYITACLWVFLPRQREANADAAQIPFRNETLGDTCPAAPTTATVSEMAQDEKERV